MNNTETDNGGWLPRLVSTLADLIAERDRLNEAIEALEPIAVRVPKAKPQRKQRAAPPPAANPEPAAPAKNGDGPERNENVTPLSDEGIAIGRKLGEPFSATDIAARLDGGTARAYTWVAAWKRKEWIETSGFGQYRRAASFGEC